MMPGFISTPKHGGRVGEGAGMRLGGHPEEDSLIESLSLFLFLIFAAGTRSPMNKYLRGFKAVDEFFSRASERWFGMIVSFSRCFWWNKALGC